MTGVLPALCWLLAGASRADVVVLADGSRMRGVVLEKRGDGLNLQVDDDGFVDLSSATVAGVRKESAKTNAALKARWRAKNAQAAAAERKDRALADAQRAKGMVLYEGEWMKPVEAEQRLAAKRLDAEIHRGPEAYVPHEAQPSLPVEQGTLGQPTVLGLFPLPAQPAPRRRSGRVLIFKDGQVVEKRGRWIDMSGQ